jgi:hypothetical protein
MSIALRHLTRESLHVESSLDADGLVPALLFRSSRVPGR